MHLLDYELFVGASKIFRAPLEDEDGDPLNLTLANQLKIRACDKMLGVQIFDLDLTVDGDPLNGVVIRNFIPSETVNLTPDEYRGQIKITFAATTYFSPIFNFSLLSVVAP
jgi:hypothetical protein